MVACYLSSRRCQICYTNLNLRLKVLCSCKLKLNNLKLFCSLPRVDAYHYYVSLSFTWRKYLCQPDSELMEGFQDRILFVDRCRLSAIRSFLLFKITTHLFRKNVHIRQKGKKPFLYRLSVSLQMVSFPNAITSCNRAYNSRTSALPPVSGLLNSRSTLSSNYLMMNSPDIHFVSSFKLSRQQMIKKPIFVMHYSLKNHWSKREDLGEPPLATAIKNVVNRFEFDGRQ